MKIRMRERAGFTLLEILVAMAILMIIVLMMATLFHQSSMAWNNGLRQAEMSIKARSAMSLMRRDLSQAVASKEYPCSFYGNGFTVFVLRQADDGGRAVRKVQYTGGTDLLRSYWEYAPGSGGAYFGSVTNSNTGGKLLENLDNFQIVAYDIDGNHFAGGTNLPAYVDITMTLSKSTAGAAAIRVWSNGRDHIFNTDDDVKKRLRTWQ